MSWPSQVLLDVMVDIILQYLQKSCLTRNEALSLKPHLYSCTEDLFLEPVVFIPLIVSRIQDESKHADAQKIISYWISQTQLILKSPF